MKKSLCPLLMLILLAGCGKIDHMENIAEANDYSYIDDIAPSDITSDGITMMVELNQEYTPENMLSFSDNVVLATIHSIDSADMKYNSMVGFTYGTMQVEYVLYGDVKVGDKLAYAKPGGIISYQDWNAAQPVDAQNKRAHLQKQSGVNTADLQPYVDLLLEDDIHIDTSKTYLMYLKFNKSMQKYEVIGLGNGVREVIGLKQRSSIERTIDTLQILNNTTQEKESLEDYIKRNIPMKKNNSHFIQKAGHVQDLLFFISLIIQLSHDCLTNVRYT